jgi:membrane protein required for beta-lactamase induction
VWRFFFGSPRPRGIASRPAGPVLYDLAMSTHKSGELHDKLGQIAMRTIAATIVLMGAVVLVAKGIDGFPYGIYGLIAAGVLVVVSLAVGQVE